MMAAVEGSPVARGAEVPIHAAQHTENGGPPKTAVDLIRFRTRTEICRRSPFRSRFCRAAPRIRSADRLAHPTWDEYGAKSIFASASDGIVMLNPPSMMRS
jgi:hypothetical protein